MDQSRAPSTLHCAHCFARSLSRPFAPASISVIIAIIVESFLKVKKEVDDLKADQNFFIDCYFAVYADFKSRLAGWPSKHQMLVALQRSVKFFVGPSDLLPWLPEETSHRAVRKLFQYYNDRRFPFLHPSANPRDIQDVSVAHAIDEVEHRIAGMLAAEVSTPMGRLKRYHRKPRSAGRGSSALVELSSSVGEGGEDGEGGEGDNGSTLVHAAAPPASAGQEQVGSALATSPSHI